MTSQVDVPPRVVAVRTASAFLHLIQSLQDTLGSVLCTICDWGLAIRLVDRVRPKMVILNLLPGREELCWPALADDQGTPCDAHNPGAGLRDGWLAAGDSREFLGVQSVFVRPDGILSSRSRSGRTSLRLLPDGTNLA